MPRPPLETFFLDRISYREGREIQAERVEAIRAGRADDALFLLEHDPVITLGRSAERANVVSGAAELETLGIAVEASSRGGDVTYHGPGQLVGYPILNLARHGKDLARYVRGLEAVIIHLLDGYGIDGRPIAGRTGVWVENEKVAAIGIHVTKWITMHGFALNVTTDLDHFKTIIPCGIRDAGVTSLERLLGRRLGLEEVAREFARAFAGEFGYAVRWSVKERQAR
jgi:lipoyl(octanoyl) transferase